MPPLSMHVALAREIAAELRRRPLEEEAGAYYLGATSPDIRVITRCDRRETHFFDLDDFGHQSGVARVFEEYPELADTERLDDRTKAFLAGYMSHLEMDETWICDIYRPCFGKDSPLRGDLLANLLDRVLQYELDRRAREDQQTISDLRRELLDASVDVAVRFLDRESLERWREVSADVISHPPTWERFGRMASRHLRAYGVESEEDLAHFLRNISDLLDQAVREVTLERIEAFQERSRLRALETIRGYLS